MKYVFGIIAAFLLFSCSKAARRDNLDLALSGGDGVKYWDIVYATDTSGTAQPILNKKGTSIYCIRFDSSSHVVYYTYKDANRIVDRNCGTDVIRNPDSFTLRADSIISFEGSRHKIVFISKEYIILRVIVHGATLSKAAVFYKSSTIQNKKIITCN